MLFMTSDCTHNTISSSVSLDVPAEYRLVLAAEGTADFDKLYGKSPARWIVLPIGMSGKELLEKSKQTKAELMECIKRGASFDIKD